MQAPVSLDAALGGRYSSRSEVRGPSDPCQALPHFPLRLLQSFIVLDLARMPHETRTGTIDSKRVGTASTTQDLHPEWTDLIERAWDRPTRSGAIGR